MTLKAIIHPAEEGGFWAEVPALPGCVTQGETEEEIHSNLLEAVELCTVRVLRLPHAHLEEVPGMLGRLLEAVVRFV
jgi:predicted RNase H-like HicB family nuclease